MQVREWELHVFETRGNASCIHRSAGTIIGACAEANAHIFIPAIPAAYTGTYMHALSHTNANLDNRHTSK